ncbi:MAG: CDP-alcohol phosphatidyltransferase family protein [Methanotrichaceae archaeon]
MFKARLRSEDTDRILRGFASLGLGPNAWTALSIIPALAGFTALVYHSLAIGLLFFVISGFIDMIDGAVARATNSVSSKGAFIDGVLDRYVELLLILGLMIYLGRISFLSVPSEAWMVLLLFGAVMTSFVRAYADHRGIVKNPEELKRMGGFLERAERLLLLYIAMIIGLFNFNWMMAIIAITAALANATAIQRILFALKHGNDK